MSKLECRSSNDETRIELDVCPVTDELLRDIQVGIGKLRSARTKPGSVFTMVTETLYAEHVAAFLRRLGGVCRVGEHLTAPKSMRCVDVAWAGNGTSGGAPDATG